MDSNCLPEFDNAGGTQRNADDPSDNEPDQLTRNICRQPRFLFIPKKYVILTLISQFTHSVQLKHALAETNKRLSEVIHDLKVLSDVVSTLTNPNQTTTNSLPSKKTRGGRSAVSV